MVDPNESVVQQRRRLGEEKNLAMKEETQKLVTIRHVCELQYPEWPSNMVMVKKTSGK